PFFSVGRSKFRLILELSLASEAFQSPVKDVCAERHEPAARKAKLKMKSIQSFFGIVISSNSKFVRDKVLTLLFTPDTSRGSRKCTQPANELWIDFKRRRGRLKRQDRATARRSNHKSNHAPLTFDCATMRHERLLF